MAKKKSEKEVSWEQIGATIAKKLEKHHKEHPEEWKCWSWSRTYRPKGHFFGALLFGIIMAVILNQQEILLSGVSWWIQALLVFGFALMFD